MEIMAGLKQKSLRLHQKTGKIKLFPPIHHWPE
jgi:hypothetical protein